MVPNKVQVRRVSLRHPANAVEEAYSVLGGVSRAAELVGLTRAWLYFAAKHGRIAKAAVAKRVERLTAEAGHKVPAGELLGVIPWHGRQRRKAEVA